MMRCPVTKVANDEVGPYEVECDIFKVIVKYEQLTIWATIRNIYIK